ncbi:hypothetical protein B0T25DRAFT_456992 [Lasiosphaeria hispida]|uniref:F-box domain-containing protein n=1 Tax=Lasiosphaeria hispida TaxID=260671 RepID=A0AAJ0MC84_9PEZI|nr:hypothetical protein B0T25DRAFT_456992 [Lasiosphaeria hispida]
MRSLLPSRRKSPPVPTQGWHEIHQATVDFFGRLPVELLLAIFTHFSTPADVLSALNVCRSWRRILLSADIWPPLAERFAPGLAFHIRTCSPPTSATRAKNELDTGEGDGEGQAFHSALLQQHLRSSGHFSAAAHYTLRLNLASPSPSTSSSSSNLGTKDSGRCFTLSKALPVSAGGVHGLSAVPGLDPSPAAETEHVARLKLYSHGRVAWWPEGWHMPYFAVVDDLRSRTRRMYLFPFQHRAPTGSGGFGMVGGGGGGGGGNDGLRGDQQRGWKTAMGEVLFVIGQEDAGVCVWHLERDEMRRVELPGAFDRCVVQGERLLFVGRRAAEVWTWSWSCSDGGVELVDASAQGCYAAGPVIMGGQMVLGDPRPAPKIGLRFRDTDVKLDFILHPTDTKVVFVVTYDEVDLVVHELTTGRVTDRVVLPRDHLAYRVLQRSRSTETVQYLRHERCDAYGGYCLATAWLGLYPVCGGDCAYVGGIGSVVFNVHTKRFAAYVHHAVYQRTPEAHLWNGLLAVGVCSRHGGLSNDTGSVEPAVVLLKACDRHTHCELSLQLGDPLPTRRSITAQGNLRFTPPSTDDGMRPRPQHLDRVVYALATGSDGKYGMSELGWLDVMTAEWLHGDDKTLIYVTGKEYTVWVFGEDGHKIEERKGGRSWRERWRRIVD